MRITLPVKNLKEITDLLNTVVTEVKLQVSPDGISVKAVDPAHVAMISLELPKQSFTEFSVEGEDEMAVDVERLKSVLKVAKDQDDISVSKENGKLSFEIGTINKKINLLDNSSVTTPKIPHISSDSFVVLMKTDAERGLKAAEDVSDAIRFTLSADDFSARSFSDTEESEMRLPKDMLKEISCKGTVKSLYPLEYLLRFMRSLASAEEIKISFKDDYPMIIDFKFGRQGDMTGSFLLAPRMEQ
ncbi:MAG: DNA polymerase sliding clamp [Candidatus Thermoplasmatota archaeon]|jgi:proliferating cell nuclear antigen|nr:DNA polymerase sliding clamp [Candidatus Thermoplasmatota archaeon]MCL5786438.1 DNA polymerase sliding clamp [Candidatus Thermoplasmatota archaeon]